MDRTKSAAASSPARTDRRYSLEPRAMGYKIPLFAFLFTVASMPFAGAQAPPQYGTKAGTQRAEPQYGGGEGVAANTGRDRRTKAPLKTKFEEDVDKTSGGGLTITSVGHSSVMFTFGGKVVHVDPVGDVADYSPLPKADLIL